MVRAILLDADDNVATLIDPGEKGDSVSLSGRPLEGVALRDPIQFGHKLATRPISRGEQVLKYGKVIGQATQHIAEGEHVHVHNVEALRARGDRKDAK